MDDRRFDAIARSLGHVATRRDALALLVALAGIPVNTAARKRQHHDHPPPHRQVQVEARCRLNGSPCNTSAQCCSRKCEGGKGHKKCKSCTLKACSAKADLCRGGAICGCKGNPNCACWTGIAGDPVCASLPYGVCTPCENDATCEGLFGVAGSRCIKAESAACGCKAEGNPNGTACVAPCGQRCIPRGVDCENDTRSCCSGKCGCTVDGCFCRDAQCVGFDQPCIDTDWWTDCCEGRCAGEAGAGFCTYQGHCSSRGEICSDTNPCCSGVCDWRETPNRCRQLGGGACNSDSQCWAERHYPARCIDGVCCTPPGASCASSAECCKGQCENGTCKTPIGGECGATSECSVTKEGDVLCFNRCGIRRGGACTTDESCLADECRAGVCCQRLGSPCYQTDECCLGDGICGDYLGTSHGSLSKACCHPPGDTCTAKEDCCDPSRACTDGRCCSPLGSFCYPGTVCCEGQCGDRGGACCNGPGGRCSANEHCCPGALCDTISGTCATCLPQGLRCSGPGDCCAPLVCDYGGSPMACQPCGTKFTPCTSDEQCCNGPCVNGLCPGY
ncbi:MAG: hypothetical protein U0031_00055 [Thermomicrobiales bacterium]